MEGIVLGADDIGAGVAAARWALGGDGWLADLVWWVQSPVDLFRSPPLDPRRPLRRVHVDRNGNVTSEPPTRPGTGT